MMTCREVLFRAVDHLIGDVDHLEPMLAQVHPFDEFCQPALSWRHVAALPGNGHNDAGLGGTLDSELHGDRFMNLFSKRADTPE
jgi:hypothetical protein